MKAVNSPGLSLTYGIPLLVGLGDGNAFKLFSGFFRRKLQEFPE
jgi:hypothetical protein